MPTIQKTLRILEFIRNYQISNSVAPTIAEIGKHFDMSSTSSVHRHLKILQERGWIRRQRYSRLIQIVEQEHENAA